MSEKHIKIVEGDDTELTFTVRVVNADGSRSKYDLTGATILFSLLQDRDDASPIFTQSGIVSGSDTDGVLTVQLDADDVPTAGTYWYKVQVTISAKVTTVAYGICTVINV